MTVTQTSNGASKHGFQITAENNSPSKIGGFAITDATNTHLQSGNNFVTHSLAGTDQSSWDFTWTAPSSDVGAITFYVASIAGNLNSTGGTTTVDTQMAQSSLVIGSVLAVNNKHLLQFSMFPNPSSGQVNFQLSSNVNQGHISIFDYTGKLVLEKNINTSNNSIDVAHLSSGIYIVRIQTDSKIGTKKLIVRK